MAASWVTVQQVLGEENVEISGDSRKYLLNSLVELKENLKDHEFRCAAPEYGIQSLMQLLRWSIPVITDKSDSFDGCIGVCTECVRALRNACAGCVDNQNRVVGNADVLDKLGEFVPDCIKFLRKQEIQPYSKESVLSLLRCIVQFLGNTVAGNTDTQIVIWEKFFPLLRDLLQSSDPTLFNYTCMLVYSCQDVGGRQLLDCEEGVAIIVIIIDHLSEHDSEWRRLLVEVINAELSRQQQDSGQVLNEENALYLVQVFCERGYTILGLCRGAEVQGEETLLVTSLLEVLCHVACKQYSRVLDENSLLKSALNMLQSIHEIGREGDNVFSTVGKLSEVNKDLSHQPAYGVKKDLVRLLANMCYDHRGNQDLVRELGGIPVILDHTNIDGKNPYITQWSILAIRNLCANNKANQEVINGLRLDGLGDNVDALREFGVEAELAGDKIVVKNVKKSDHKDINPFGKKQ